MRSGGQSDGRELGVLSFTEEDALEAFCKQVQVNGTLECSVECVHQSEVLVPRGSLESGSLGYRGQKAGTGKGPAGEQEGLRKGVFGGSVTQVLWGKMNQKGEAWV